MPPKGGDTLLSDAQAAAALDYMLLISRVGFCAKLVLRSATI